jgi:hypothetical protein
VVSLISYARFEIENGGVNQFYHNTSGDYGIETVWAFEQIGAPIAADVIRRANALFPNAQPSRDTLAR